MDAIEYFKGMRKRLCEDHLKLLPKKSVGYQTTLREMSFYDAAINALEQQPCEDAISRAEAIRIASGYCHWTNIPDELAKLPSVNPQKTGQWEEASDEYIEAYDIAGVHTYAAEYSCSVCRFKHTVIEDFGKYAYCPNCGCRMVEPQDEQLGNPDRLEGEWKND